MPRTGVRMVKDKQFASLKSRANPNRIPEALIRFMRMWRTSESKARQQREELSLGETCYVCGFGPGHATDVADEDTEGEDAKPDAEAADSSRGPGQRVQPQTLLLELCPFCLLTCHAVCAEKLALRCAESQPECLNFSSGFAHLTASSNFTASAAFSDILAVLPRMLREFDRQGRFLQQVRQC